MTRTAPNLAKKAAHALVAEISEAELTLRFAEIGIGISRPPMMTPEKALAQLNQRAEQDGPEARKVMQDFRQMAREAILYFGRCIEAGVRPS